MFTKLNRYRIGRYSTLTSSATSELEVCEFIQKTLNISPLFARIIVGTRRNFLKTPREHLIKNCELLKRWNVSTRRPRIIAACLMQHPTALEHKILMLDEFGLPVVTPQMITSIRKIMNTPVCLIKAEYFETNDTNVICHAFGTLVRPPPNRISVKLDENLPIRHHYNLCESQYQKWRLGRPVKQYFHQHERVRSLRLVERLLNIFLDVIGLDKEYIINTPYLLDMHPDKVCKNLIELKNLNIAGMPLRSVIQKYPSILTVDVENVEKLLSSFEKYEIPDLAVSCCLPIFKIPNELFVERIEKFLSMPDLRVWSKHPRILYTVLFGEKVFKRIARLKHLNRTKWTNMAAILGSQTYFSRYIHNQASHTCISQLLEYVLQKELGKCNGGKIKEIQKHPHWRHIPLSSIDNTLKYLKERFTMDDICQSIHIILYPRSTIIETLEILYRQYSNNNLYNFTPAQYLMMCVYMLEKGNHFTGDGVWSSKDEHSSIWSDSQSCLQEQAKPQLQCNITESLPPVPKYDHLIWCDMEEDFPLCEQEEDLYFLHNV